ncbi:hypothetical protein [Spirosoma pollinicola]|uniref:Uncharacterized protein n=1 Tax=Spirosoma pollinicola TaxID=2057025 RepID=A0A2K8Z218_9BACT|nr:hypothetical protein [Spirosoma pollinicola]AUD03930.1 hypothetical protein CWM47_20160 [Spirosoma pollinicola]
MKLLALGFLVSLAGTGYWYWQSTAATTVDAVHLQGPIPAQTTLAPTPRSRFTPTPSTRKGFYSLDIVSDFSIPSTKTIIFCGAGRNLHVQQDRTKIFRRGFSAVDQSRMVSGVELWRDGFPQNGWKSVLQPIQRALIVYRGYFRDAFSLGWAENSEKATETVYRTAPVAAGARPGPVNRNTLYQASMELRGGCVGFGDCSPSGMKSTYGFIVLDIENDGTSLGNRQEQANLYTYMIKILKENASPQTLVGSIAPVLHNSVGYSRAEDYKATADWLWNTPARHTASSRQRGMPDDIVGKSFSDYADFQMPGTYYVYPDFDYSIRHNGDNDRHWLAALLGEQEVNMKLSPKKRIAWQWLFNTQSELPNSAQAEHPAPPAVAEGMGIFYWFTGAYGVLFWDDHTDLIPDQPSPTDPNAKGVGNDRNYTCYEHYVHGLWRLFKHHSDLFNGRETYLNEATECSYDNGQTWYKYNANQIKTHDVPFVRAIVNGDQILIAATKAYAPSNQTNKVMMRYVQNGYTFYTTLTLKGDEIYLGRATMNRDKKS